MKESKVHLVSAALGKNNNQNHFYNNPHLEFLEEQTSVNKHLMNCVSQLDQSCKTILNDIRDQNIILNKLNNNHRYDYGNIKKILLNFAQTSKESKSQLQKVGQTLQVIHVHLDNQSEFNEVTNKRTENLERALSKLQGSVNRQRNFLNNFAIKQNSSFDNINAQLGQHGKQFDTQREIIQDVIEEQKRFFTIVSKNLKEQNLLHKIYSDKEDELIHNNTIFNLLNEQFNRQKEILIELSETQNNQFDLIVNQFKEQNHFNNCLSEKQALSEEMDELIFEEIKLQITQQDDIYNYLQDSLNRQQGFLLQLSDNQNRQLEKVTTSLGNIKETEARHNDTLTEVKASIEKILYAKGNIGRHLSKLPPDYPIKQVILSGVAIPVEKIVLVNQNTGIAFFASGTQTLSIDIEKIEGIHWE